MARATVTMTLSTRFCPAGNKMDPLTLADFTGASSAALNSDRTATVVCWLWLISSKRMGKATGIVRPAEDTTAH